HLLGVEVAGRADYHRTPGACVRDRVPQRAAAGGPAEAEVDDIGVVVGGPDDSLGRHGPHADAVGVEGLDRHDLAPGAHASHPQGVGAGRHDTGDRRAVAVVVAGAAVMVDEVVAVDH